MVRIWVGYPFPRSEPSLVLHGPGEAWEKDGPCAAKEVATTVEAGLSRAGSQNYTISGSWIYIYIYICMDILVHRHLYICIIWYWMNYIYIYRIYIYIYIIYIYVYIYWYTYTTTSFPAYNASLSFYGDYSPAVLLVHSIQDKASKNKACGSCSSGLSKLDGPNGYGWLWSDDVKQMSNRWLWLKIINPR